MTATEQTASSPLPENPVRKEGARWWIWTLFFLALFIFLAVAFQGYGSNTGCSVVVQRVISLECALMQYKTCNSYYPSQAQGLDALVTRPTDDPPAKRWNQSLKAEALIDPWSHRYQYRNPGTHNPSGIDVFSYGPDGIESEDDIGNW